LWWGNFKENHLRQKGRANVLLNLARFVVSFTLLLVAAGYLLRNGLQAAVEFKWSAQLAGATLLVWAVGVPELGTGIVAAVKKKAELSIGSILGVNMMCLTLALGVAAWLAEREFLVKWQQGLVRVNGGEFLLNDWRIFGAGSIRRGELTVMNSVWQVDVMVAILMLLVMLVPAVIRGRVARWQGVVLVVGYGVYLGYLLV
jgi:cation:H+ antiporter